jgi:hypothetical protein
MRYDVLLMSCVYLLLALATAIILLFYFSGRRARENSASMSITDAIEALEEATDNSARHDRWDDFLSWPIKDPFLEAIRLRALQIAEDAVQEPGRDISLAATEQLRSLLAELRPYAEQASSDNS